MAAETDLLLAGVDGAAGYMDLYRRWEEQNWRATGIDFTQDRVDWEAQSPEQRTYFRWALTQFFQGEESVTISLAPFIDAAPDPEQRLFLTTQIADEARHAVLLQRFFAEVIELGAGGLGPSLEAIQPDLTPGFKTLFFDVLGGATGRLRDTPDDPLALVRAVTVYHLIVEGTVALAGQRHILENLRERDYFPGLREGFVNVTRDESRHVGFGVLLLRDAVAADPAAAAVIAETVLEAIPAAVATLEPPGGDDRYYTSFGYTRESVAEWALASLGRRLHAIGVPLEL
ncbi:MAG: ribonucleotide-diphosphate reductase subunit beta [Actinomycetota bacterium]|nr:ribonucleotide-diphosphate reductase subunit beta [Actinomycetota bacterium]